MCEHDTRKKCVCHTQNACELACREYVSDQLIDKCTLQCFHLSHIYNVHTCVLILRLEEDRQITAIRINGEHEEPHTNIFLVVIKHAAWEEKMYT